MAGILAGLSGCSSTTATALPHRSVAPAHPGVLGGYDPARNGSKDVNTALAAGSKDGRKVLMVFGANDNPDSRALALLSGDRTVASLLAGFHVVTVDVGDPGPHLTDNRAIPERMFLDLHASGVPAVVVMRAGAGNQVYNEFSSDDGSFAHARSMSAAQLAAFLKKWQ